MSGRATVTDDDPERARLSCPASLSEFVCIVPACRVRRRPHGCRRQWSASSRSGASLTASRSGACSRSPSDTLTLGQRNFQQESERQSDPIILATSANLQRLNWAGKSRAQANPQPGPHAGITAFRLGATAGKVAMDPSPERSRTAETGQVWLAANRGQPAAA